MIFNPDNGLLPGPYSPGYATDARGRETVPPAKTAKPAAASKAATE